jgi:hypothetical protein
MHTEDSLELCPRQRLRDAPVRAKPKSQGILRTSLAVHVENIRAWENIFVPVRRLVGRNNALASLDQLPKNISRDKRREWIRELRTLPPSSMSVFATRFIARADPVWYLQSSSTNAGASDGSAFNSSSWFGFLNSSITPYEAISHVHGPSAPIFSTHQRNHVYHRCISGDEQEKRDLDGVRPLNIAWLQLLCHKLAD